MPRMVSTRIKIEMDFVLWMCIVHIVANGKFLNAFSCCAGVFDEQFDYHNAARVICHRLEEEEEDAMRVGMGYDIHRLVPGRRLVLGGVVIPYERGLWGHSDADVLTHAVCDALLGAAGRGDIGFHFPDTDATWAGIDSLDLLRRVNEMIRSDWSIENVDATVMAEAPKIGPYREKMSSRLAVTLEMNPDQINIKATTMEGLGPVGRGEGIAAQCVVLLRKRDGRCATNAV